MSGGAEVVVHGVLHHAAVQLPQAGNRVASHALRVFTHSGYDSSFCRMRLCMMFREPMQKSHDLQQHVL